MIKINDREYPDLESALASVDKDNDHELIIDLNGEKIQGQHVIDRPYVTIRNGSFEHDLGAYEILEDGYKRGTFRTYTLFVDGDKVRLDHLSIINKSLPENGQAIALMSDGDDLEVTDCFISSYQDTLFLAPLPDEEYEARGFIGPLMDRPRTHRKSRFENCLIEGSIDFIFGGGQAYFQDCELRSRFIKGEVKGYVSAPSTPEDERYGFIFENCRFTSEEDMEDSVYLARPWRDHGKVLIKDSKIGPHIKAQGYHDWNKDRARETCEFKEYNNTDLNKTDRVKWMKQVTDDDLYHIESLKQEEKK